MTKKNLLQELARHECCMTLQLRFPLQLVATPVGLQFQVDLKIVGYGCKEGKFNLGQIFNREITKL